VVDVRVFNRHGIEKDERAIAIERYEIEAVQEDKQVEEEILVRNIKLRLNEILKKEPLEKSYKTLKPGDTLSNNILENLEIREYWKLKFKNNLINSKVFQLKEQFDKAQEDIKLRFEDKVLKIRQGDDLLPTVMKVVKVFVAVKRRLMPGDKMAGRHGNKGVISKIVPVEDMPYMESGKPVDIVLNPLGVPSRMNVGQILETHLGWSCSELGEKIKDLYNNYIKTNNNNELKTELGKIYGEKTFSNIVNNLDDKQFKELCGNLSLGVPIATPVFDGATTEDITKMLEIAKLPNAGQTNLWDGRTGEKFDRPITVGIIYMLKLHHLVEDKIHARSTGPYSLVTQQPLGGRAQLGGQRFGEMEVWALEAYGASYTLQEILTVKSDDVAGRTKVYETIVKGDDNFESGVPESFNVLIKEIRALGLNIELN
jgi:DNA-directed RNA polymerase subunit beta